MEWGESWENAVCFVQAFLLLSLRMCVIFCGGMGVPVVMGTYLVGAICKHYCWRQSKVVGTTRSLLQVKRKNPMICLRISFIEKNINFCWLRELAFLCSILFWDQISLLQCGSFVVFLILLGIFFSWDDNAARNWLWQFWTWPKYWWRKVWILKCFPRWLCMWCGIC